MKSFEQIYSELKGRMTVLFEGKLDQHQPNSRINLLLNVFAFGLHRIYEFFEEIKRDIEKEQRTDGTPLYYRDLILSYKSVGQTEPLVKKVAYYEGVRGLYLYPLLDHNKKLTNAQIKELDQFIHSKKLLGFPVKVIQPNLTRLIFKVKHSDSVDQNLLRKSIQSYVNQLEIGKNLVLTSGLTNAVINDLKSVNGHDFELQIQLIDADGNLVKVKRSFTQNEQETDGLFPIDTIEGYFYVDEAKSGDLLNTPSSHAHPKIFHIDTENDIRFE